MKTTFYLFTFLFLASCNNAPQQKTKEPVPAKPVTKEQKDPALSYTITLDTNHREKKWMVVFQTEKGYDTLFTQVPLIDGCTLSAFQLDNNDLKEIDLTSIHLDWENHIGNLTNWDIVVSVTKHEFWNLREKQKFFSAVSHYHYRIEEWYNTGGPKQAFGRQTDSSCYYYKLAVGDSGKVTIRDTRIFPGPHPRKPDHAEGIYVYINGEMILQDTVR